MHTAAYTAETPGVKGALLDLETEFTTSMVDRGVLKQALQKAVVRVAKSEERYRKGTWLAHTRNGATANQASWSSFVE